MSLCNLPEALMHKSMQWHSFGFAVSYTYEFDPIDASAARATNLAIGAKPVPKP